ncbi:hypothetical protein [Treponema zioleckii]|uniref:hypothetical protein n=1 Tax=Treponema zioleckii TaxID=331680 RepID=UPI00168B9E8B|nr:hypothetical protein [Treponema zioleckii]
MKKIWFFLMQKRFFKKPGFIIILLLVIPMVFSFRSCASKKSGILTVALCQKNTSDSLPVEELASKIMAELESSVPNVNFVRCDGEEVAKTLVLQKKVDCAWIFDRNLEEKLDEAGKDGLVQPVVTAFESEENSFMAFSRELLYMKVYPIFSYSAYKNFVLERFGPVSEEILKKNYDFYSASTDFFVHESLSSNKTSSVSYLLTPMRGLLAVWLMLCAFASSVVFMNDEKNATFVWIKLNSRLKKFGFSVFMQSIPVFDAALVLFLSVFAGGLFTNLHSEIIPLLFFLISAVLFSNLLRMIFKTPAVFCAALPLLILVQLVVCPIFVRIQTLLPIQYILPPFYYLNSVQDSWFLTPFAVYVLILAALNFLFCKQ